MVKHGLNVFVQSPATVEQTTLSETYSSTTTGATLQNVTAQSQALSSGGASFTKLTIHL